MHGSDKTGRAGLECGTGRDRNEIGDLVDRLGRGEPCTNRLGRTGQAGIGGVDVERG